MTDDREILQYLLSHPQEPVDEAWVRSMDLKYPYFAIPALLKLRASGQLPEQKELERLYVLMGVGLQPSGADPAIDDESSFYPPAEPRKAPSTTTTIDTFLATYGTEDPSETATLEKLIFNPVADYSQTLARERKEEALPSPVPTGNSHDDMINRFILSRQGMTADDADPADGAVPLEAPAPPRPPAPAEGRHPGLPSLLPTEGAQGRCPTPPDNSLLSESLAKIFIKSRRYERAYEILANLSLAFPEKSAYFADQMRFLRKLMLNEQFRRKRENDANH